MVAVAVVGAAGCVAGARLAADGAAAGPTTVTTAVAPTTSTLEPTSTSTSTTLPETTTTGPRPAEPLDPAADGTLESGEDGEAVLALQRRLTDLGYWLGEPDGTYGRLTAQAVMAFQKYEGLGRDGVAGPVTLAALDAAARPVARHLTDGIEIDLERQVLLVVTGGEVRYALNTSTGASGWRTRTGEFEVEREIDGVRHAPLGDLWRPKYFSGGQAIHGSPSIPGQPASHGCARLSNAAMDMLWSSGLAEVGTAVTVY